MATSGSETDTDTASCLSYVEVAVTLRMLEAGTLPPFKGATLRGAFGHHLKRLACHVEHGDCGRCLLGRRCVFPVFFEGAAPEGREILKRYPFVPQPFVLAVDATGPTEFEPEDRLTFGMRLFGPAADHLAYVAYAFMRIGESGLGRDRLRYVVERIDDGPRRLFAEGDESIAAPAARRLPPLTAEDGTGADQAEVTFRSPVRLRKEGHLAERIEFAHLMRSIVRRLSILTHFYGRWIGPPGEHGRVLDLANEVEIVHNDSSWIEFSRYSGRQGKRMMLGGVVGKMKVRGPLGPLLPWLRAAEIVHVGKATSFGFGRTATEVLPG